MKLITHFKNYFRPTFSNSSSLFCLISSFGCSIFSDLKQVPSQTQPQLKYHLKKFKGLDILPLNVSACKKTSGHTSSNISFPSSCDLSPSTAVLTWKKDLIVEIQWRNKKNSSLKIVVFMRGRAWLQDFPLLHYPINLRVARSVSHKWKETKVFIRKSLSWMNSNLRSRIHKVELTDVINNFIHSIAQSMWS